MNNLQCDAAVITGSGFYDFPGMTAAKDVRITTPFGNVAAVCGDFGGKTVLFMARHKKKHALLSNMINHKANIHACRQTGAQAIIATSVVGITNPSLPLAKLLVFNDIFYPDNRLPDGSHCTFFTQENQTGQGHLLFESPFFDVSEILADTDIIPGLTYAYVNGPRFNSKKEIRFFSTYADAVSQTAGPEIVLAGELEIPYALLGFGVDYANGVQAEPTPVEVLADNMNRSKTAFIKAITRLLTLDAYSYNGFIFRFD